MLCKLGGEHEVVKKVKKFEEVAIILCHKT